MSSSISSATSQQQFIQVPQNPAKTDTTDKTANTSNTNLQSVSAAPAQNSQQPAAAAATGVPEPRSFRNNDGSFGPGHTPLPPYNPLKPSTQGSSPASSQSDTSSVGVNVKV